VVVTEASLLTSLESLPTQELDHRIVAWFSGLDLPLVTPLMKLASAVGSGGIVFVGIAV
jgi:hypothetical protein